MAAMDGRFSVAIDDIKKVAIPVLRHRISTNFQAQAEGKTSEDIIQELLKTDRRAGAGEVREAQEVMFDAMYEPCGIASLASNEREPAAGRRSSEQLHAAWRGLPGHISAATTTAGSRVDFEVRRGGAPLAARALSGERGRHPRRAEYLGGLAGDAGNQSAAVGRLMQHMIGTKQLFTLQEDADDPATTRAEICSAALPVPGRVHRRRLPGRSRQGFFDCSDGLARLFAEDSMTMPAPRNICGPKSSARSPGSTCAPSSSSRGSSPACTPARFTASPSSSPSTASTCPATTSRTSTGTSTPRPTSTTSRSSRPRPTSPATWSMDLSASMAYTYRQELTKFEYAICLAAALGYLMIHQQDPVGLVTFDTPDPGEPAAAEQADAARQHPGRARQPEAGRARPTWPACLHQLAAHDPRQEPDHALQRPAHRSAAGAARACTTCGTAATRSSCFTSSTRPRCISRSRAGRIRGRGGAATS